MTTHNRSPSDADMKIVEMPQGIGVGPTENLVHIRTNKKGRIIQKFGCAERMESLPGQQELKRPWFQIFSKDDRITEIIAQNGTVDLEDSQGQIQVPNRGVLNNVQITMYRLPKDTARIPSPLSKNIPDGGMVEMAAQLPGTVYFEREISQLRSDGECTVESEWFAATGTGLSCAFDQNNERLQELELKQVKQLRLTRKDPAPGEHRTESSDAKKKTDSVKKDKAATYRFTLSENVVANQPDKNEKVLANRIEVIADFDPDQYKPKSQEKAIATEEQNVTSDTRRWKTGIKNEPKKNIYITCDGPLKIALAPEYEPTPLADRLLLKAAGNPAQIWKDGKLTYEADTIEHDQTSQCTELSGGPDRPVRMAVSSQQWATAQRKVTLDPNQNLGTLYGPGCIKLSVDPNNPEDPNAVVFYEDTLQVNFTDLAGSLTKTKTDEPAYIKSIIFKGPFQAQSKDGYAQAQKKGKLRFFIPPETPKTNTAKADTDIKAEFDVGIGPIQSIELWGNVIARDKENDIRVADRLEATFDYINPNTSHIRSVHAFGPIRTEDPNYIIKIGDTLQLAFSDSKHIVPQSTSTWGFDQLLSNANLLHAIAEGADGTFSVTDKQNQYQIIGDRAQGNATQQLWTVTGQMAQVIDLAGQRQFQGNQIIANLANQTCHVVGPGQMDTVLKGDLFGENIDRSMRMHIDWNNGVTYKLKNRTIAINDADARIESTEGAKQITWLHCPRMTITLDPDSSPVPARSGDLFAKLDLESFRANGGQVRLRREEYDPVTHQRQNELELNTEQLHYDNRTRSTVADGPGTIESTDYRSNIPNNNAPKNPSINQVLSRMFASAGPTYTLLRFGHQMRFDKDPNQLQFSGGVALDHFPLTMSRVPSPEQLAHLPGRRTLDCNDLILVLADANTETRSGESDVTSGFQQTLGAVHRMTALGRVFVEANFKDGARHSFSGEKLTYDNRTKEIVIVGSDTMPAYLDQMQFRMVIWNLETNHIQGIPLGQSILSGSP